ncbi:MAG: hypothetical protein ACO31I_20345 [Prochlorotrichaceae cyanobacterium]|jgi:hypothetical protein
MSNLEQLNKDIAALPQGAQQLVIDLVDLLKQHYSIILPSSIQPIDFTNNPFVGMWIDRLETQDSIAWVRQVRQQHWHK